jgi:lysophospholipase L1-like esterase
VQVVVAGNSASLFVVPPRTVREDGTYGELLPGRLPELDVRVVHTGRWYERVDGLRSRYEEAVRNHFPDVLVLHYGMAECQTGLVPWRLSKHVLDWDQGQSSVALAYRRAVARPVWRALREGQRRASAHLAQRPHKLSPERFGRELEKVVTMVRDEVRPLVLVVDVDPPGPRVDHWLPGTTGRALRWNALLERTVDRLRHVHGDEVRLVRASQDVDPADVEALLPDGLHRNAEGHRLLADRVAAEVRAWTDRRS